MAKKQAAKAQSCPDPRHGGGQDHEHDHDHSHHHIHTSEKSLVISIILNIIITAAQIAGGLLSGSLALLSDAFHNLSDAVSLVISYIALLIGKKAKSATKTYGYKRAEILAALANVVILFLVSAFIIFEAAQRIQRPEPINSTIMLVIAFVGLFGNGISVLMLLGSAKEDINIKSALLHLIGDTFSSIGVIIVAIILHFKPLYYLDSLVSIMIALYIIKESLSIFLESVNILMQGAPKGIDKNMIIKKLKALRGVRVRDIHHIHMWDITPGKTVFDAHIVIDRNQLKDADNIIIKINHILNTEFHISHSTIQLESGVINKCVTCDL
jgi:cobalt-zinc-cadmium efflux system protein